MSPPALCFGDTVHETPKGCLWPRGGTGTGVPDPTGHCRVPTAPEALLGVRSTPSLPRVRKGVCVGGGGDVGGGSLSQLPKRGRADGSTDIRGSACGALAMQMLQWTGRVTGLGTVGPWRGLGPSSFQAEHTPS